MSRVSVRSIGLMHNVIGDPPWGTLNCFEIVDKETKVKYGQLGLEIEIVQIMRRLNFSVFEVWSMRTWARKQGRVLEWNLATLYSVHV